MEVVLKSVCGAGHENAPYSMLITRTFRRTLQIRDGKRDIVEKDEQIQVEHDSERLCQEWVGKAGDQEACLAPVTVTA
jgi:hypothetical protein